MGIIVHPPNSSPKIFVRGASREGNQGKIVPATMAVKYTNPSQLVGNSPFIILHQEPGPGTRLGGVCATIPGCDSEVALSVQGQMEPPEQLLQVWPQLNF